MITLQERLEAFDRLSRVLLSFIKKENQNNFTQIISESLKKAEIKNQFFIPQFVLHRLSAIADLCSIENLNKWTANYNNLEKESSKRVGLVMAGNIPIVGFHDLLSALIAGFNVVVKMSSKDDILPRMIIDILIEIQPKFADKIFIAKDKLENFDLVIATGSSNTTRYFEYYFRKVPSIIRSSRNSLAVLTGNESQEQLDGLADDVLLYFGLGCRNVSKIFLPENYDFNKLFGKFYKYSFFVNYNKYMNNYEYHRAIFIINKINFLENGFLILKEDSSIASPVGVLHYEYFSNIEHVKNFILSNKNLIQTVVASEKLFERHSEFGKSQMPNLWDYDDGIDTLDFLLRNK